jgi:hypothetical protein
MVTALRFIWQDWRDKPRAKPLILPGEPAE